MNTDGFYPIRCNLSIVLQPSTASFVWKTTSEYSIRRLWRARHYLADADVAVGMEEVAVDSNP